MGCNILPLIQVPDPNGGTDGVADEGLEETDGAEYTGYK